MNESNVPSLRTVAAMRIFTFVNRSERSRIVEIKSGMAVISYVCNKERLIKK